MDEGEHDLAELLRQILEQLQALNDNVARQAVLLASLVQGLTPFEEGQP